MAQDILPAASGAGTDPQAPATSKKARRRERAKVGPGGKRMAMDGLWEKRVPLVQGLVNVSFWGFSSHHRNKYLLEMKYP